MRRRPIAAEQAGGAKHKRPGADGGDIFHLLAPARAKTRASASSCEQVLRAGSAGNDHDVERRTVLAGHGRDQDKSSVGPHRIERLGDDMDDGVRQPGKNFEGLGKVNLRHRRKQQQPDMARRSN